MASCVPCFALVQNGNSKAIHYSYQPFKPIQFKGFTSILFEYTQESAVQLFEVVDLFDHALVKLLGESYNSRVFNKEEVDDILLQCGLCEDLVKLHRTAKLIANNERKLLNQAMEIILFWKHLRLHMNMYRRILLYPLVNYNIKVSVHNLRVLSCTINHAQLILDSLSRYIPDLDIIHY